MAFLSTAPVSIPPVAGMFEPLDPSIETKFHYVRWHISDYLLGTQTLSFELEGAYQRFLMQLYANGRALQDDDRKMSMIMRTSLRIWKRVKDALIQLGKICVRNGCLTNHRFEKERLRRAEEMRNRAGAANARWAKADEVSAKDEPSLEQTSAKLRLIVGKKASEINDAQDELHLHPLTSSQLPVKKEGEVGATAVADPPPDEGSAREAFDLYNQVAKRCGLSEARILNPGRQTAIRARLKEAGGIAGFKQAMYNLERSAFLRGANNRKWKADLTFVCQPSSFAKLLEGTYGGGAAVAAPLEGQEDCYRYAPETDEGGTQIPDFIRLKIENDEREVRGEELMDA